MRALCDDFDFNLEQIAEIEAFNQSKIDKIGREMADSNQPENARKFKAIIEAQKQLGELEEQIDRKIALQQSDSSTKGLRILPQVEKILDDLVVVRQI